MDQDTEQSMTIIRQQWLSNNWSPEVMTRWRNEFEKRLLKTPSHWDQQYAQLHIDVLNELPSEIEISA